MDLETTRRSAERFAITRGHGRYFDEARLRLRTEEEGEASRFEVSVSPPSSSSTLTTMDFRDTAEVAEFRSEAAAWLAENAPSFELDETPDAPGADVEKQLEVGRAWMAKKAEAGWACLHWPETYGGRGLERFHSILFAAEESRYRVPVGFFHIGQNFAAPTLMEHASEEAKARHLPRLLSGEELWCQLFSEPGAGSDLAGIRTRAVRDGDVWTINGQKIWTTYAHLADYAILVTRHDPSLPKHKGLTYFYLDMKSEGVEARPIRQIAGTSSFNEVFLTNARIPDGQRLGEVGAGWQVALTTLMNERAGAGSAQNPPSVVQALRLATEIQLEHGPAIADASVRDKLASWYVRSRGLELIHQRTMTALAQGRTPGPESSIRKLVAASQQQDIANFGIDLQELGGSLRDPGDLGLGGLMQQCLLGAPGARIAGGTDEILRNIIAERVLGLPGDIRVDRDRPFDEVPGA